MIFDSHAHYDDRAFDEDRDELLMSLPEKGVGAVVNAGASIRSVWKTLELAEKYPNVYAAAGIHPEHAGELREEDMEWLRGLLASARVVAVGEIGLDYYWDQPEREIQKKCFAAQMGIAKEEKIPVVVHSRDAAADTLELMRTEYGAGNPAYIHCFSYPKEIAAEFLKLGYMIGIGGVVTFKNAKKIREVVEYVPLERILLETDCPYLAPVPHRGERNSSLNLPLVIRQIAQIKGVEPEKVEEITWKNAVRFFGLTNME